MERQLLKGTKSRWAFSPFQEEIRFDTEVANLEVCCKSLKCVLTRYTCNIWPGLMVVSSSAAWCFLLINFSLRNSKKCGFAIVLIREFFWDSAKIASWCFGPIR